MRGSSSALALLVLAAACGPVADAPDPVTPLNACPQHSCDTFTQPDLLAPPSCSAGVCTSATAIDFTLVASLPESSFLDEGVTIAIPRFVQFSTLPESACQQQTVGTCVQIPSAARPTGSFFVSPVVQSAAGRTPDIHSPDPNGASLPVQVQFLPFWTQEPKPTASSAFVDAALAGLPLMPVRSRSASGGIGLPQGQHGPQGTLPTLWAAVLGPQVYYRRYIVPQDDSYPAVLSPLGLSATLASDGFATISSLDAEATAPQNVPANRPPNTTFNVTRNGSLEGFVVYLRDVATGLRVSSRVTLHGSGQATATLLTIGESPYAGGDHKLVLVVAPPDGLPVPTLADPVIVDHLGPTEPFPALPPFITVSGTVRASDGQTPIEADLVIDSTPATGSSGGITTSDPHDATQPHLTYSTSVHAGPDGRYSVVLPPGAYDVFLRPALDANAGAVSVPLTVQPAAPGEPLVAAGKDLVAAKVGGIYGIAKVADGRAMAGAVVEAHVAASLAATLDPRRWPRAVSTTADLGGAFVLTVDPGIYDVVVRPAAGTGFPWVTSASQTVPPGIGIVLYPIAVPAPVAIDVVLHDQGDNPLINAMIRAFAPPANATPSASGAPAPELELGTWLTDASGHVTMFVAPPQ